MSMTAWAVIQAALEYGGSTGGSAGMATPTGLQSILAWVAEHRLAVIGGVALLLLLGLSGSARRT